MDGAGPKWSVGAAVPWNRASRYRDFTNCRMGAGNSAKSEAAFLGDLVGVSFLLLVVHNQRESHRKRPFIRS